MTSFRQTTRLTLAVVLDGHRGDAYGVYDTGTGAQETKHFASTADQLAGLTAVLITQDYYEPTDHLGADFDDLEVRIQRPPAR